MFDGILNKQISVFVLIFIFLTIFGTLLHELGHFITAYYLNFKPNLHYASVSYEIDTESKYFSKNSVLLITMAGPIQTLSMGLIGVLLLRISKIQSKKWWIGIFLSLFLLRQVFVLFFSLMNSIIKKKLVFGGDEVKIARLLNINSSSLLLIFGILSLIICMYIYFIIIPKKIRFNLYNRFNIWIYFMVSFIR